MVDRIKTAPKALKEIAAIFKWYEKQKNGLGDLFFEKLDFVFEKILLHPEHYMFVMDGYTKSNIE